MPALNILLVEDNEADISLAEQAIQDSKLNSQVTAARSGREAAQACHEPPQPFDLLLLDIGLPDLDGLDALDEMKQQSWQDNTVVVALTGNRDPAFIHMARERGVHALLTKPLNVNDLVQVLKQNGFFMELVRT
ncbi:MAG: response regulator [Pseudomonadales bacterium]